MKKLVILFLLCLTTSAHAFELAGAKLDDKVQVAEKQELLLNGAGIRTRLFFRIYVAGLYLGEKKQTAEAVLADSGAKRIALHVVIGEVAPDHFLDGFRKGIEKNHTAQEVSALRERMQAFDKMFEPVKSVKKGDEIDFDWLPGTGTRISMNSAELGRINGEDFYHALLKIWLGDKPVDGDLKKGLLGG